MGKVIDSTSGERLPWQEVGITPEIRGEETMGVILHDCDTEKRKVEGTGLFVRS